MFGVDEFVAIINPPEAAILAVGAIKDVPVVEAGQIVPGKVMRMTLSVDHRVFYGATAAQFMAEVKRLIENPVTLVVPLAPRRDSCGLPLGVARIHDSESPETEAVKTTVARRQAVGLPKRMGAYQEVADEALPWPAR